MRQTNRWHALVALVALVGCYQHHGGASGEDGGLAGAVDAGPRVDAGRRARDAGRDAGSVPVDADAPADSGAPLACDLSAVECTALPGCLGSDPPETLYCDDVRICLFSDPGDEMARAIAAVAERVRCDRADSCDYLCGVVEGIFDDEVRAELCAIARVAPSASIECAVYGP